MSIATQSDIEALLQIKFDVIPEPKAVASIEAAQRMVEAYVGVPFDAVTGLVVNLTGRGRSTLTIPRYPVSAATVVADEVPLVEGTDYVLHRAGYLEKIGGVWWTELQGVEVTYDAGWADHNAAPAGLRELVARVAARIWQTGVAFAEAEGASGIVQETIGSYSVTYGDFAKDGSAAVMLTEDDRAVARRFSRSRVGGVST